MVSDLQKATALLDYKTAVKIQDQLTNFHSAMFCETNPIPVKYALSLMGFCENEIRLPLCAPSLEAQNRIKVEMKNLNLIS
jgi:4-hydroxy-tetrahydrodipicolinate synthase